MMQRFIYWGDSEPFLSVTARGLNVQRGSYLAHSPHWFSLGVSAVNCRVLHRLFKREAATATGELVFCTLVRNSASAALLMDFSTR